MLDSLRYEWNSIILSDISISLSSSEWEYEPVSEQNSVECE